MKKSTIIKILIYIVILVVFLVFGQAVGGETTPKYMFFYIFGITFAYCGILLWIYGMNNKKTQKEVYDDEMDEIRKARLLQEAKRNREAKKRNN